VLVLNCDYRRPRLQDYFPELRDSPDDQTTTTAAGGARATATNIAGVRLVTGLGEGSPDVNPAVVIESQKRVVDVARRHFDVIILDTAPLLLTDDASELVSDTDVVVLVARAGRVTNDQAEAASELLERLKAPVLGVVFTDSGEAIRRRYYGYGTDRGYYS
jgi:Mrp family chromosome partitioning ATPase